MSTLTLSPPANTALRGKASASAPVFHGAAAPKAAPRQGAGAGKRLIQLLLADDHPVVRKGLRAYLEGYQDLRVVGEAGDGQEALRLARELAPDLVLMDIDMPRLNGLAVTELLRAELPHIKVLILSMHRHPEYILRVLQSGASGYLLKEGPPEDVVRAIHQAQAGQTFFSPEVARVALNQFVRGAGAGPDASQLTSRECDVLTHIAKGLSNKETACQLKVGVRTVETHRERIMRKLQIRTVAGLTRFALAQGYISLAEEPLY